MIQILFCVVPLYRINKDRILFRFTDIITRDMMSRHCKTSTSQTSATSPSEFAPKRMSLRLFMIPHSAFIIFEQKRKRERHEGNKKPSKNKTKQKNT